MGPKKNLSEEHKNKATERKKREILKMTPKEKHRQRALTRERIAGYKKRKKAAFQESHVKLASVNAEPSATSLFQSAQGRDQHAVPAQLYPYPAVQSPNAAAAPQVAPLLPLHCPSMEVHPDEDTF